MNARTLAVVGVFVALACPALAQECTSDMTPHQCFDAFEPKPNSPAANALTEKKAAQTTEATTESATGLTNSTSPAESSLKDFLALLAASLETATTSEQGNAFTFDWNPRLGFGSKTPPSLKLQASIAEASLNDEVITKLGSNADGVKKLKDTLDFGDDATLTGSLQWNNVNYGRNLKPHREAYNKMLLGIAQNLDGDDFTVRMSTEEFEKSFRDAARDENRSDAQLQERIDEVEKEARAFFEEADDVHDFHKAFASLLNNQPQYYLSVLHHSRRNVVGPNEWGFKATYEYAGNNLNTFRRDVTNCDWGKKDIAGLKCGDALANYAKGHHGGIDRLSVALEYHRSNRRWIDNPDLGLAFGFPRSDSFVGSVAFGASTRQMLPFRLSSSASSSGVGDARVDLTVKYEKPKDDKSDQKGFVGTLTYTQKISEGFSLPLSFVYSDHESDLANVQKRFSARFGLMYKLPSLAGMK